ncbi:DEAD/DEAH box helicase [Microcoleus sp. AT9b-C5]|uniref:DEAD/DEAH box helicase n=1 Tax=unclassified Microcoleus TaxID=2642155 RepID=UPI002FD61B54
MMKIGVIPKTMTNPEPVDYAALIRAVTPNSERKHPEWLDPGQPLFSPKRGQGEVMSWMGNILIAKFPGYLIPVQFKNWQQSVETGEIAPVSAPASSSQSEENGAGEVQATSFSQVSAAEIAAIPQPQFRAIAQELASNLSAVRITPPASGSLSAIPKDLPSPLQNALRGLGIHQLYSHQIEALDCLRKGCDLSIVTPTASGKSLCYNLPILEDCLNRPHTSALYIFPLKALAFDQFRKLQRIVETFPSEQRVKVGQMTGDTPPDKRLGLFVPHLPNILAVSPDLLHHQLSKIPRSQWEPWRQFLRRLRWVVIDESHSYIGAFGAHFANLMRRLRRAVDSVGGNSSKLQFICSSATIGNPRDMALRFSGRMSQPDRLHLIEGSGAGSAGKTVLCLAPSDTANSDACKIVLAWLQQNLSGIVFCNSRGAVKKLVDLIHKESTRQGNSYLAQKVTAFYGSLKSDRRQNIISQLQSGKLKVIISTSALEAGLDLPELDCCLVKGYPGSIMSFRQRLGRAGRISPGFVIFLPIAQNSLDYYYGKNPDKLLLGEVENAAFNPNYPTIMSKHLECCCVESGLPAVEVESRFDAVGGAVAEALLHQDRLFFVRNSTLRGRGEPHLKVNIRGNAIDTIELIDDKTGESFEEMSRDIAYREVFPGAIYTAFDEGNRLVTYRCQSLDIDQNKAILQPFEEYPSLFTEPDLGLQVELLENLEAPRIIPTSLPEGSLTLTLGWGKITSEVAGYKLFKREYRQTCTNVKCRRHQQPLEGKICPSCGRSLKSIEINKLIKSVPFTPSYQIQYEAPVVKVEVNPALIAAITDEVNRQRASAKAQYGDDIPQELEGLFKSPPVAVALHSMAHQIQLAVPLVVLSSTHDVNSTVELDDSGIVAYFFDTTDGGNGASEEIGKQLPLFAAKAMSLALNCECSDGCPKCLIQIGCPQQNQGLHKKVGLFLLEAIATNSSI